MYKSALEHLFSWLDKTRGNNPIIKNAKQELAKLHEDLKRKDKVIFKMRKCVGDNAGLRNEYQDFEDVFELAQKELHDIPELPFTTPDPTPVSEDEIRNGL